MKKLTLIHASISLTVVLASGAAGSVFYARDAAALRDVISQDTARVVTPADDELSTDLLDRWKADARTTDYISPRVPL